MQGQWLMTQILGHALIPFNKAAYLVRHTAEVILDHGGDGRSIVRQQIPDKER